MGDVNLCCRVSTPIVSIHTELLPTPMAVYFSQSINVIIILMAVQFNRLEEVSS